MPPRTTSPLFLLAVLLPVDALAQWNGHGSDPQHTAVSNVASESLERIRWSMSVDENAPSEPILIHYGSPIATAANTIVMPVRTTAGTYRIQAMDGSTGSLLWQASSDFITAPSNGGWVPNVSPTLTPSGALYYQGSGGTVYRVDNPNAASVTPLQISFLSDYAANKTLYDSSVFISTPLTSDATGQYLLRLRGFGGRTRWAHQRHRPNCGRWHCNAHLCRSCGGHFWSIRFSRRNQ
jgi:hypothetical protein